MMKKTMILLLLAATATLLPAQRVELADGQAYTIQHRLADGQGFTITLGDEVVGYSDQGALEADDLPPALTELLEQLSVEQQLVRKGRAQRHVPRRAAAVAPMLTTRWGQRMPYNLMCPEYAEGSHCATGCLAVAMAQVLKYWAADIPTTDIPAYTTETLGINMPALPATSFNYSIINDAYEDPFDRSESTWEVARLMLYCGQASQMDYDISSGSYTMGRYLSDYFGFSSEYTDKDHWTHLIDWEDYIYEEMAAGRPVIYSGKKMSGAGHVFVVDGYENGYFHINWGWNGSDNGFFKLTLANPDDPDSAYLWEGYRWLQMAVVGLQPDPTATGITALPAVSSTSETSLLGSSTADYDSAKAHSAPRFDLQGRRIIHPRAHGLYISNGKKVRK